MATDRSLSFYTEGFNFHTKKFAAVEATEAAALAITTQEHEHRCSDRFDWMMQMKSNSEMYKNKANKLKHQIF